MKKNQRLNINTEKFKKMRRAKLRTFTLRYYMEHLKGKKVAIEKFVKVEVLLTARAGRKIAQGGIMYAAKAAAIPHLEVLIANSTYNNWGKAKETDPPYVLGFLNFKTKIVVDGVERHVRIAIMVTDYRIFELKSVDFGNIPPKK